MSEPVRVFLIGLNRADLDRLRARITADGGRAIAGAALLDQIARATVRTPDAIDAIDAVVLSPAAWAASAIATRSLSGGTAAASTTARGEILIEDLTPRERDVLALVADGRPNRDIAKRLGISEHTVKFHLASIFGKLGVSTRTHAVRRALDWGLIEL